MKTSELIKKLLESLVINGDVITNINDISWHCESEGGKPEKIKLSEVKNEERKITE